MRHPVGYTEHNASEFRNMPKILAVVNGKGGVGKTTTSVTLADIYSTRQRKILFVDADPQGSATRWLTRCEVPFDYSQENDVGLLGNLGTIEDYDLIVVDTPPYRTSQELKTIARSADLLLMPTSTDWMDLDELIESVDEVVKPAKANHRILLTLIDPHSVNREGTFSEVVEAQNSLGKAKIPCLKNFVRDYKDFPDAHKSGKIVTQVKTKRAANAIADYKRVARELQRVWGF